MSTPAQLLRSNGEEMPFPLPEDWSGEDVVWTGNVRLQQRNQSEAPVSGLQPLEVRKYLVVAPIAVLRDLQVGESGDTFLIQGKRYLAREALQGSYLWEADIFCDLNQTQNQ